MRRRVFWGLAAATAALAIFAGIGTFGFFTSTQTNPGNTFTAGQLVLGNDRSATFILTAGTMQPGDVVSRNVTLTHAPTSSVDMNYTVQATSVLGALCPELTVTVTRLDAGQDVNDGAAIPIGNISLPGDTLSSFAAAPISLGSLNNAGNTSDGYSFTVGFINTGLPNQDAFQGATCTVGYTWVAVQQASNDDLTSAP